MDMEDSLEERLKFNYYAMSQLPEFNYNQLAEELDSEVSSDNEETFTKRFDTYMNETSLLIEYYKDKLFEVDSSKDKYEIFNEIERIIGVSNDNN